MSSSRKKSAFSLRRIVFYLILLPLLYLGGVIAYGTFGDYQPPSYIQLPVAGNAGQAVPDTLSFVTWNIGYAGLGKEMDFFYDGGERVRPEEKEWEGYFSGIKNTLSGMDSVDFLLLQEVDSASKRSWYHDEYTGLGAILKDYVSAYSKNYFVDFVPKPWFTPLGAVNAGLTTFAKFAPDSASRYAFPGNYGWPKKAFLLDRCFMVFRYALQKGKELLVINTHNSAYDKGGLKAQQMEYLKDFLLKEYEKGNYIVVGGDWNQNPPYFRHNSLITRIQPPDYLVQIDPEFLPEDWQWMYDPLIPTNRDLVRPYDKDGVFRSVIDFFLCSPNVEVLRVKAFDMQFQYSDHQPVYLKIRLKS